MEHSRGFSINQSEYDVMVVGSGPAGNTLAYKLAKDGLSVILIENTVSGRKAFIRLCH
jgi:flavin-dependent dehydrogenase